MGKFLIFYIIFLILPLVNAVCIIPSENMEIKEDTFFCYGDFNIENGVSIVNDNVVVDCNNSILIGNGVSYGILLKNKQNVIVQNCNISDYEIGIYLDNTNNSILRNNYLTKNKFGIALFNSFNNDVNGNLLEENIRSNAINYLLASLVEEKKPVEIEEEINTPQKIIKEVIKIKKPFLEEGQILNISAIIVILIILLLAYKKQTNLYK